MDSEIKAPEISTRTDLTIDEARDEYIRLTELLKKENKPRYGWARHIQAKIDERQMFLRETITNLYIEKELNNGK